MADFWEREIQEYPSIPRTKTWKKETKYRIRVLYRLVDGLPQKIVDLREHILSEKGSNLTNKGMYFTRKDLDQLITTLTVIWKEHFGKVNPAYGPRGGSRETNSSHIEEKKEFF